MNQTFKIFSSDDYSSFSSSKILFGLRASIPNNIIQVGRTNPNANINIQNAIPPINKNKTIPKMLIPITLNFVLNICRKIIKLSLNKTQ